ncbi:MAG: phosphomannomutase/phosphoglucomutase [Bacilli bacterium]|jgi:phosphomannomutase/phosphoglucomutase
MKITNNINENIFRGYDIRGIYEKDLTIDVAYTIGLGFGTKLRKENKTTTIIGYDNRESSPILFEALAKGIIDTGIDVINLGLVTTPMYYYALTLFKANSGIMITGSHNPKEYNGFKMTFTGIYNAYGEYIKEFKDLVLRGNFLEGQGKIVKENIEERYLNYITSSIKLGDYQPKIVVDCGNGTPAIIIKKVLDKLNIDYYPLYCESDPNYPNHHPDPSVEKNLEALKNKVLELKADVGFAYDGDGDRVGMVDELGKTVPADHFMIIVIRNLINKIEDKRFLYDVKCSKAIEDEIIKLNGTPICYRTGNSYVRAKIYEEGIKFGGELSGHIFFNDKFHGFDDGVYSSLRMIEIISKENKAVSSLLEGISKYYSTEELKIKADDNIKFKQIEQVKEYCLEKNYNILTIDGCKVLFEDGFALIRASNTGPNITMRFEAKTETRLKEIKEEFETLLKRL